MTKTTKAKPDAAQRYFRIPLGPTKPGRDGQAPLGKPIVPRCQWWDLPDWVTQCSERESAVPLCYNGHRLLRYKQDGRSFRNCKACGHTPRAGESVLACRKKGCEGWMCCRKCEGRKRFAPLATDPLFHGPRSPCLLEPLHTTTPADFACRGTVIIVPGGNYEFLVPHEAEPVVDWLSSRGLRAMVLRYRLLPSFCLEDAMDDLQAAAEHCRLVRPGEPVAAIGFSAGGHLVASLGLRGAPPMAAPTPPLSTTHPQPLSHRCTPCCSRVACPLPHVNGAAGASGASQPLDCQLLVYPGLQVKRTDWFWHTLDEWGAPSGVIPKRAEQLIAQNRAILGLGGGGGKEGGKEGCKEGCKGRGFGAPPSFVCAASDDTDCPCATHTDPYVAALRSRSIPVTYVRRKFGGHGFGLTGGWTGTRALSRLEVASFWPGPGSLLSRLRHAWAVEAKAWGASVASGQFGSG